MRDSRGKKKSILSVQRRIVERSVGRKKARRADIRRPKGILETRVLRRPEENEVRSLAL
jgi:hypothetical protein